MGKPFNKANEKTHKIRPLYLQLIFTALAFFIMIIFSYRFLSDTEHNNLRRNTESMLTFEREKIQSDLLGPKTSLGNFSETLRRMIINGYGEQEIKDYAVDLTDYIRFNIESMSSFSGFYGYFETLTGGAVYIDGLNWIPPDDYVPAERDWYLAAVAADGKIVQTEPYVDKFTNETVLSFARCIYDDKGQRLGVVSLDVQINEICKYAADMTWERGGYGMLFDSNMIVLAHPVADYIGMEAKDLVYDIAGHEDKLRNQERISELSLLSYKGEESVGFFQKLSNGWYLGVVMPKAPYFESITYMTTLLSVLGIVLAVILCAILVRIDAAKRKSDMESLRKSTFLANMSHEIRTPMNAIISMTSMGKTAPDTERKDYCLSRISDASYHLLGVINDILDMSKIESDKLKLSFSAFNFESMINRVVSIIKSNADEKKQTITVHFDKTIPKSLMGDDQRLAQVVTNLLSNSVKFTAVGGSLTVKAELFDESGELCTIQVAVSDTGIGISPEQQENIFQIFEQAEADTTRKYGGTGLGLAIAKNLVEMMDGRIWIDSELGKGATFTFTVKLKRGGELHAVPDVQDGIDGIFSGYSILLAEDVDINREIVLALLEPTEIQITCAENGKEAVRLFSETPEKYNLIFMDIQMPEMDGYEATRHIRALPVPEAGEVPIIAMTANVFREDVEKSVEAGMNAHIGKPLDFNEVINKLKTYLK